MLVGGDSGVVVIPHERAEEVLKAALAIDEAEQAVVQEVRKGSMIKEARVKFGYHSLQSKR